MEECRDAGNARRKKKQKQQKEPLGGKKGHGRISPSTHWTPTRSPFFFSFPACTFFYNIISTPGYFFRTSLALRTMVGESRSYCEGTPPMQLPPTPHEDDCNNIGSIRSTSPWRQIFAPPRCGAGSSSPTLGANFMRASQTTTKIKYNLAALCGDLAKEGSRSKNATLTLGQDLHKLGLGAVVWDCVSGPTSSTKISGCST